MSSRGASRPQRRIWGKMNAGQELDRLELAPREGGDEQAERHAEQTRS